MFITKLPIDCAGNVKFLKLFCVLLTTFMILTNIQNALAHEWARPFIRHGEEYVGLKAGTGVLCLTCDRRMNISSTEYNEVNGEKVAAFDGLSKGSAVQKISLCHIPAGKYFIVCSDEKNKRLGANSFIKTN